MDEQDLTQAITVLHFACAFFLAVWLAFNAAEAVARGVRNFVQGVKHLYRKLQRVAQEGAQLEADAKMHREALRERGRRYLADQEQSR